MFRGNPHDDGGLACCHGADSDLLRDAAFIDGAWVAGEQAFDVTNPADGALIARVPFLGTAEAMLAVDAASRAQPGWARLTGRARGEILHRWADLMLEREDALARLMTAEQGKPLAEAVDEVAYAASFLELKLMCLGVSAEDASKAFLLKNV